MVMDRSLSAWWRRFRDATKNAQPFEERDPTLATLRLSVGEPTHDSYLQHVLSRMYVGQVERAQVVEQPLPLAPASVIGGPFDIGLHRDQSAVGLWLLELARHGLIVGPTGSAKSSLVLVLLQWLLAAGKSVVILDFK